jgi:hypothetical protein
MQRLYQYKAAQNQGVGMGEYVENSEIQLPCDLINTYYCEDCNGCFGIKSKATHIGNYLGDEKYLCVKHARIFQKLHLNVLMGFCLSFEDVIKLDKTKPIGLVPFSKQECLSIYHLNLAVYTQQIKSLSQQFTEDPFIIQIYVHPEESRTFFKIDPYSRTDSHIAQKYSKDTLLEYWNEMKNLVLFYDYRNDNLIYELLLKRNQFL